MSETRTTPQDITAGVVASFDDCPDPRLREIMQGLARHVHEFAREVRLLPRAPGDHRLSGRESVDDRLTTP